MPSQNHESDRLWDALSDVEERFYVDVGAGHPHHLNVTEFFYEKGWRGINLEPGPNYAALADARPEDMTLPFAVSDKDGTTHLYINPISPDLSSLEPDLTQETTEVITIRLDSLLSKWEEATMIGFLKIDVEGHERAVLAGNDWNKYRPLVIVIEAIDAVTKEMTDHKWGSILYEADYSFAYFDGVNNFYYRNDRPELEAKLQHDYPELSGYPREKA